MYPKIGPEHLRDFERRRSLRFVLPRQEDIILTAEGCVHHGKLEDISIGGAKLRLTGGMPPPSKFTLSHETAGAIEGVSMWHEGNCIGVSFELTEPALRLISLCLRQGVPNGDSHAA